MKDARRQEKKQNEKILHTLKFHLALLYASNLCGLQKEHTYFISRGDKTLKDVFQKTDSNGTAAKKKPQRKVQ